MEDFVPWASLISSRPPAKEEKEKEEEIVDLVQNYDAWKSKRGANFKQATGATPEVDGEVSQQPFDESLDVQAIVISDSPEMGFHGQSS